MPPQSRNKGESKQGLVITLVFFILATLGLGVSTYYGFDGQEKKDKEVKEAKKEVELVKDERNWYKFQAMMYRSYMGQTQTLEDVGQLATLKTQFDQGSMKVNSKDKEEATKVLKGLGERFGWTGNKPNQTYESKLADLNGKYETLAKTDQGVLKANKDAKSELQKKQAELDEAQKNYKENLDAQVAKAKKDQEGLQKQIDDSRKTIDTQATSLEKANLATEQAKKTLGKQNEDQKKELTKAKERIAFQQATIEEKEVKSSEAPQSMRTDWKITEMDPRGTKPYINLGSADNVKPQLTFTIHGVGLDGRPIRQAKGTLEVVNVIGPHLSQTRITGVKDANREPILKGDILYNPSWNPTLKKHVALAGIMDITGDGRDSLREFMRNLERQNIVVDAYLDPKDGTVKGEITLRTDYLILGESQAFSPTGRVEKDDGKAKAGREEMQAKAQKYGVKPIALHKYLEMIGYRLPRSVNTGRPSLYNPNLRPDQAPRLGGAKQPAMKPDK
jgi:hypothetical protein